MKIYEKEYEDVLTSKSTLQTIKLDNVGNTLGLTNYQFAQKFHEVGRDMYVGIFDSLIKFVWMSMSYSYKEQAGKFFAQGFTGTRFSTYCRNYIGIDFKAITQGFFPAKIATYFKDFFPKFILHNPYEEPDYYKYPYQHVTPDFLILVYQMKERLELLDIAEKQKMTYAKFYDYIVNYVMCYNDDHNKEVYDFFNGLRHCPIYVRLRSNKKLKKREIMIKGFKKIGEN